MFESALLLAPILLALFGVTFKRLNTLEEEISGVKLMTIQEYVTKKDLTDQFDRIIRQFDKLERKLEAVYMVERDRSSLIRSAEIRREMQFPSSQIDSIGEP